MVVVLVGGSDSGDGVDSVSHSGGADSGSDSDIGGSGCWWW